MIIRNFKVEDYDEVINLWKRSGLKIKQSDSIEEIKKKLERDKELFLVAEDNEIIGAVIGAWDGRRAWIYHLAVLPERRNEDIGTKIIKESELRLKKKGAFKINLLVEPHNQGVQSFYEKQEYKSENLIFMTKKL
ncbi:GNAT family acetyltransferase [Clostridium sp. Marseille-QA1073]